HVYALLQHDLRHHPHGGLRHRRLRRGVLMARSSIELVLSGAAASAITLGSCVVDPVHDSFVKSLGPDTDLPESEFHRPGQPCVECHSNKGPAKSKFVLGGTLYYLPHDDKVAPVPVDGADVYILDARGSQIHARTNCRGNFFVRGCVGTCPAYLTDEVN